MCTIYSSQQSDTGVATPVQFLDSAPLRGEVSTLVDEGGANQQDKNTCDNRVYPYSKEKPFKVMGIEPPRLRLALGVELLD